MVFGLVRYRLVAAMCNRHDMMRCIYCVKSQSAYCSNSFNANHSVYLWCHHSIRLLIFRMFEHETTNLNHSVDKYLERLIYVFNFIGFVHKFLKPFRNKTFKNIIYSRASSNNLPYFGHNYHKQQKPVNISHCQCHCRPTAIMSC